MESGEVVDGRYTLVRLIGEGGFGEVWEAEDARMQRTVALKIAKLGTGTKEAERFVREAVTAGRLNHPHIVTVHDYGTAEVDGLIRPYLVMELIDGEPLDAVLARALPLLSQALLWAEQICDALAAAHHHGVMHRDIKPANVLVQADGRAKVVDFGIARNLAEDRKLTTTGGFIGSLAYMAPEGFSGEVSGPRCDLYALGCLLTELCTGHPPFPGPHPHNFLHQHTQVPPPALRTRRPGLPVDLDALVLRLLAKAPHSRPHHATQVRHQLHALRRGLPIPDQGLGLTPPAGAGNPIHSVPTLPPHKAVLGPASAPRSLGSAHLNDAQLPGTAPPGLHERDAGPAVDEGPLQDAYDVAVPPGKRGAAFIRLDCLGRGGKLAALGVAAVVAALLTTVIKWPFDSHPVPPRPRVLAVVGDFAGVGKVKAQAAFNSVQLALARTEGITARTYDNSGTPDGSQQVAERIVADEEIVGVIAPVGESPSDVMAQASKTFAQQGIAVLSPWTRLTGDLGTTTYQVMGATSVLERATADFLTSLDDTTMRVTGASYVSDGSDEATATVERISAATGSGFPSDIRTVDSGVAQLGIDIAESGHNVVYYAGAPKAFHELDAALSRADYHGLRLAQDTALDGVYKVKSSWMGTRNYCFRNSGFDTAYQRKYSTYPQLGSVESYEAALALTAALEAASPDASGQTLRQTVTNGLDKVRPKGPCNYDLRFGRDGYLRNPPTFMDVYEPGTNLGEEIRGITSKQALQRAKKLMR
ncbi:bifunctional serine/threonine-protein kinase/ABC transporter substrate-binding protein [Streptomyces sp. CB03238]|uniref:bifunctional serine/threonine-protein kinase/ABC transporter substrate-binding protein n=1 Tax=Streptomyces sp. CB03238 TaxID=1907777 RepID=UPI000A1147EC|nr:bifunctional serine/threonine-protein kinase/ABC transporter substrate-binding protein [Streptomyces sp. CB03238]ORT60528.1 hypothetical protein BKD26_09195 [Streptomyces sp. CB03238]